MKTDLELLQGTWGVATLEMEGNDVPVNVLGGAQIVIQGDQFESLGMGAVYRGKFTLDATKNPKRFDIAFTEGHAKGKTNYGIYELKGDTWKLCLNTAGTERPQKFATLPGSGLALEILKRAAAAAKPVAARASGSAKRAGKGAKAEGAAKKTGGQVTELEGEWAMVSGVMDGAVMDESMVQWVKRVTHGNETTVMAGPQTMLKVKFAYDPSKSPKTIDYVNLAGANKGKTQLGIYEFDEKLLKVCMAAPGKPRPSEFASQRGDGRTFTVWKRL